VPLLWRYEAGAVLAKAERNGTISPGGRKKTPMALFPLTLSIRSLGPTNSPAGLGLRVSLLARTDPVMAISRIA
jgi:hypothetical protein